MPAGGDKKREREYDELVEGFKEEGRYRGREEEVAARIVNKQRAEFGETEEARAEDEEGRSPDRGLPLKDYDHLTVDEVSSKLDSLNHVELEKLKAYEEKHRDRKTLIEALDRRLERG